MDKKELGDRGERIAALYLEKKGYAILRRNYRVKGGEIDIIAEKESVIAFVEVKTRTPDYISDGFDAITKTKQKLIIRASAVYSQQNPHDLQPRFDAVRIVIDGKKVTGFNYIENAFDNSKP
jgi:putative endonuclease